MTFSTDFELGTTSVTSVRAFFCAHQSRCRRASVIKFACVFKFIISFLIMKLIASFSKYGLKVN